MSAQIDRAMASHFLTLLAEGEAVTFQTFDDARERKDPKLARIFHGAFEEYADALIELNRQGAGVFIMVNRGDGKGRKAGNVVGVRALFIDLDGTPLPAAWPLEPHVIIESSPGRWHAYWAVKDCPFEQFTPHQKALVAKYGSDPAACDLPRVMRLPGFLHRKEEPFMTRTVHENPAQPYALAEIIILRAGQDETFENLW
jgi:DNA primase RepB-like protein